MSESSLCLRDIWALEMEEEKVGADSEEEEGSQVPCQREFGFALMGLVL